MLLMLRNSFLFTIFFCTNIHSMIYHDIINNNLSFNRSKRAATSDKGRLWPNGLIPYEIDETFSGG